MDYKVKYEQAIADARAIIKDYKERHLDNIAKRSEEDFSAVFPELKESEDERIRKKLIEAVKGDMVVGGAKDKQLAIAWLEKQGEKKSFDYENANMQQNDFAPKSAIEATKEEEVDNANKVEPKDYNDIDPHFGKPIDEVEPKFNVGDWIIFNGLTLYIKEIVKGYYRTISKGGITNSYDWGVDNTARLWTIQDAKDGDVLALSYASHNYILIYKRLYEKRFNTTMSVCCFYCVEENEYYDETDNFHIMNSGEIITPATKEQRDTLFTKLHEAGYEWDSEKKQPRKIEQKPAVEWSEEDQAHLESIDESLFMFESGRHENVVAGIEDDRNWLNSLKERVLPQQKPEWSEEDERNMNWVINVWNRLRRGGDAQTTPNQMEFLENWLKSLKDRVGCEVNCTTTKEWSEEDEERIKNILSVLGVQVCWDGATGEKHNPYQKEINWLKSLRPQSTWKPSDEQIHWLIWVINRMPDTEKANEAEAVLRDLLEQLNKLREE